MTRKLLLPAALIGVLALGVSAASGVGNATTAPQGASLDPQFRTPPDGLHRVTTPSADAAGASVEAAAKKGKKPKIIYFETEPFAMLGDGDAVGTELRCPRKGKPLSGYFGANGVDVSLTFSAVASKRSWSVGITQLVGAYPVEADTAFLGVVCAKGVK
jgi:hypothetical protein